MNEKTLQARVEKDRWDDIELNFGNSSVQMEFPRTSRLQRELKLQPGDVVDVTVSIKKRAKE